ncbi:sugar transferase [Lentilactobacillus hilgardii]|uniref:sugar transferase n=1 Tax=Lentilactobacillus hilgardii TaxID=1588 RepID=UPI0021A7A0AC|nr:sugar transferase [Lentilactobacillus hilgardii]MCT3393072.1 sugar transferase [Lentilactobacillus hilgardii]
MQTEGHGRGDFQHYHSLKSNNTISKDQIEKRVFYHFFKRFFDELLSIIAIILLIPIFVITAILIKIDDPNGPIIYSQIRIGKDGRLFKMYKFRSMVVNADKKLKMLLDQNDVGGAMFKMKSDPRVTKVGRIIRKYSIDELPQLINVVKGDMSLVGPRPPLRREVRKYTEYDKQRLLVIPGCTGLWQVGERNNVGFHEMVEVDLKYIRKAGILFDFYILIRTVAIMICPNNAY